MCCKNVLNQNQDLLDGETEGLVDTSCTDYDAFVKHTDDSIWRAVDRIAVTPQAERGERCKNFGFNHEPEGVLADLPLRRHVKPTCLTFDFAHVYHVCGIVHFELFAAWFGPIANANLG